MRSLKGFSSGVECHAMEAVHVANHCAHYSVRASQPQVLDRLEAQVNHCLVAGRSFSVDSRGAQGVLYVVLSVVVQSN